MLTDFAIAHVKINTCGLSENEKRIAIAAALKNAGIAKSEDPLSYDHRCELLGETLHVRNQVVQLHTSRIVS